MLELPFGNVFPPRQFFLGQESIMDTLSVIILRVVNAVAERHIVVKELQGRFLGKVFLVVFFAAASQ